MERSRHQAHAREPRDSSIKHVDGIAQAYERMRIDRVEQERRRLHDQYAMELHLRQHEARASALLHINHERKRQHAQMRALYPDFFGPGGPGDCVLAMDGDRRHTGTFGAQDASIEADPRAVASFLCVSGDTVAGHVIEQVFGSQSSSHVDVDLDVDDRIAPDAAALAIRDKQAREQAQNQLIRKAISSGANAIVGLRFDRSSQSAHVSEVLAYGTAVKIKKEGPKAKAFAEFGPDGKFDAAALLRWALTAETKPEKAKPKAALAKDEISLKQLKAVVELINGGYERPVARKKDEGPVWGASSLDDNGGGWPSKSVASKSGWGIADAQNQWGGWTKEVVCVEEVQVDKEEDPQYNKHQSDEAGVQVGKWTRKNRPKLTEHQQRLDRYYAKEDWDNGESSLAGSLLSEKLHGKRSRSSTRREQELRRNSFDGGNSALFG